MSGWRLVVARKGPQQSLAESPSDLRPACYWLAAIMCYISILCDSYGANTRNPRAGSDNRATSCTRGGLSAPL